MKNSRPVTRTADILSHTHTVCVNSLIRFGLMLCDVINYNDVTFPTCLREYARELRFTDV